MKGKFITLEGCEGSGKSTQLQLLTEKLDSLGIAYVATREPGGSAIAEQIRKIILDAGNSEMTDVCEALLYSAARAQHLSDIVRPALDEGKLVICDRFIDSTFAYQGFAKGLGTSLIDELNRISIGDLMPDLTVFLDIEPVKAFERKGGADKNDRLERLSLDFHRRVYEGYKLISAREPERFVSVSAMGTKEEIAEKIFSALKEHKILEF